MSNQVEVFKWEKTKEPEKHHYEKVFDYYATFCQWGCDFEQFENGVGNFSSAIVKRKCGQVENVPADLIKFKGGNRQ